MTKEGLIIFVKNPELGHAKTRIAKDTGDQEALNIYKELLQITANTVRELPVDKLVYYSQFIDENDLWNASHFKKKLQIDGDLGAKMNHAFAEVSHDHDRSIIIGSDCPYISKTKLAQAFESLKDYQVVIGPVEDGGFYLLGMDRHYPALFDDMEYSTDAVFQETIDRIKDQNLTYKVLETLEDIDYYEDWKKYLDLKI